MTMFGINSWILISSALLTLSYPGKGVQAQQNNRNPKRFNDEMETNCSNRGPTEIFALRKMLEMQNNNVLEPCIFRNLNVMNLHRLFLDECKIETIHVQTFSSMIHLNTLDLSKNSIATLEVGTFDPLVGLQRLDLKSNRLTALGSGLFKNLVNLQFISLFNNSIQTIEPRAFANLSNIKSIDLSHNKLTVLKRNSFENFANISLQLEDNPWKCDCELKEFHKWLGSGLHISQTKCKEPARPAFEAPWSRIDNIQFACAPNILSTGVKIESDVDTKMWCQATGDPAPEISWFYRSEKLDDLPDHRALLHRDSWLNLTVLNLSTSNEGNYTCVAKNVAGEVRRNVTVLAGANGIKVKGGGMSLFTLCLSVSILLLIVIAMTFCLCCCRRKWTEHDEKSIEIVSLGPEDQDKSLITTINPLTKPPRRQEAPPSIASHGTELTELNRTLLDNDSTFADGSFVIGRENDGVKRRGQRNAEDEEYYGEDRVWPEFNGSAIGTLPRGGAVFMGYQPYPPDLLAFSRGRGASPISQTSTAPDSTRLPVQHPTAMSSPYGPPSGFKTLPHNRSVTPHGGLTPTSNSIVPVMTRPGYVTIPRRPRAPSWSNGQTPASPIALNEFGEPVYDNLGKRISADGWSTISPESARSRPPSITPTFVYPTLQRSAPNVFPLDRSAPENVPEWTSTLNDESINGDLSPQYQSNTLSKKIPPRPPPKPIKKNPTGPLFEDEGEDGTEV